MTFYIKKELMVFRLPHLIDCPWKWRIEKAIMFPARALITSLVGHISIGFGINTCTFLCQDKIGTASLPLASPTNGTWLLTAVDVKI